MNRAPLVFLACVMTASLTQAHPTTQGDSEGTVPKVVHSPGEEHVTPPVLDEVQVSQINEILDAQPHGAGPTKEDWLRIAESEASQLILVNVLQNPKELLIRRQRALGGLSFFPTDAHKTVVLSLLQGDVSYRLKGSAARAYGRMAGKDAVAPLALLLSSEKSRLREAVVKALVAIEDQSARDVLRSHLAKETKSYIKTSIEAALEGHTQPVEAKEAKNQ